MAKFEKTNHYERYQRNLVEQQRRKRSNIKGLKNIARWSEEKLMLLVACEIAVFLTVVGVIWKWG